MVVLTVGEVAGALAEVVGVAEALGDAEVEAEVEVEAVVEPPENRGWRNSVHESRYSTLSPSETSSMVGDTA